MGDEVADKELNAGSEQSQTEQTTQTVDEAATKQEQAATVAELVAGGQRFKDAQELLKAYENLQSGFTKKTQEYAAFRKQGEQAIAALDELRRDPELVKLVTQYLGSKQAAQPVAEQRGGVADDESANRLAVLELRYETDELRRKYPDLTDDGMAKVYEIASEWEDKGVSLKLIDAYRLYMADKGAAENFKKGQEAVRQEIKGGKAAATTQPTVSGDKKKKKFSSNAPLTERAQHIDQLFRDAGVNLDRYN